MFDPWDGMLVLNFDLYTEQIFELRLRKLFPIQNIFFKT